MDTRGWLNERLPAVERALEEALARLDAAPERLRAAMGHALLPGGKRLRPALALAAAEAVGAPCERALPMGVAVELLHTYSLIHDDLPCMDDDVERRGRPTVHVAFDEATAVLAGDALLTAAFEALSVGEGEPAARLAAVGELARAAGAAGLVGGQVDDLAFDVATADTATIESIHARKSAALIAASIVGGGILGGADPATRGVLRRCGESLGVAFQIADDLLDEDEDEGCSLLRVVDADTARARSEALLEQALDAIREIGASADPLRALARYAVRRSE